MGAIHVYVVFLQLGDGATMYLGEIINSKGQRVELQVSCGVWKLYYMDNSRVYRPSSMVSPIFLHTTKRSTPQQMDSYPLC